MKIEKNTVVTLNYTLYNHEGLLLDQAEIEGEDGPMVYLHGGYENIFPIVEAALEGKSVGDVVDIKMTAEESFGEIEADLVIEEERSSFPDEVKVGMIFEADDEEFDDLIPFRVIEVKKDTVVLDGNHPFAGMDIQFKATITNIRAATAEEIKHEHVHGEGGHQH